MIEIPFTTGTALRYLIGAVATLEQLAAWVKYARENKSILLYDAAYEAYIAEKAKESAH